MAAGPHNQLMQHTSPLTPPHLCIKITTPWSPLPLYLAAQNTLLPLASFPKLDSDFLNKINASGIPPHRLALKVGACNILIRNLSIKDGHCNGTRYIILHLSKHLIKAKCLGGGSNAEILIPRIPMISKDTDFPVQLKRLQFPVLGAYYLTLNQAHGQTLKRFDLYLPRSVFSHGHVYVGFSRCGDPDHVFVFANQDEFDNIRHLLPRHKVFTRNVVYRETFQRQSHYD